MMGNRGRDRGEAHEDREETQGEGAGEIQGAKEGRKGHMAQGQGRYKGQRKLGDETQLMRDEGVVNGKGTGTWGTGRGEWAGTRT